MGHAIGFAHSTTCRGFYQLMEFAQLAHPYLGRITTTEASP